MRPNRTIVVTGANRGIGRAVTRALARRGYRIVMACRDPEASQPVLGELRRENRKAEVELVRVDLASLASIRECAASLAANAGRIDALINNAGVFRQERLSTHDGFELAIGVNYLGTYCFTRLLAPLMNPGGRIINTSSIAALYPLVTPADVLGEGARPARDARYRAFRAYARSKLGVILFTLELAERLASRNVSVNAVHPGVVSTDMIRMGRWFDSLTDVLYRPFISTEEEGAAPAVHLASSAAVEGVTGAYFAKTRRRSLPPRIADWPGRAELWRETARLVGLPE
jgi:retinol dehydrogenase-12